jgi:hypothetical protein
MATVAIALINAAVFGWDIAGGIAGLMPPYVAGPAAGMNGVVTIFFLAVLIREGVS